MKNVEFNECDSHFSTSFRWLLMKTNFHIFSLSRKFARHAKSKFDYISNISRLALIWCEPMRAASTSRRAAVTLVQQDFRCDVFLGKKSRSTHRTNESSEDSRKNGFGKQKLWQQKPWKVVGRQSLAHVRFQPVQSPSMPFIWCMILLGFAEDPRKNKS